ncbi:MAG: ribosome biogenesis/translation initiation ATPase RLI [Candidatus Micrarchaeota archaeon]
MPRIAVIDKNKCTREKCGYQCIKVCPVNKMGTECVLKNQDAWPEINEELCTGCGLCPKRCPVHCIKIINLIQEQGVPSFQYAVNSFRLYGFVLPKEKSVLGLIGVNGIGKTTALELLRGTIKPNFGEIGKTFSWTEIKKKVRGEEIQSFLQKVSKKEIKLSFKPQFVDKLAVTKKTGKQLIDEVSEKNEEKQKIIKELELENCLNNKLSELSGGELQRIAIAATVLKNASIYFFDEPSSYLDVKQRLNAARIIKKLSETAEVIVVEHDLAVLDYLCDHVQILYGEKAAFGIVSQIKSSKNGVNEFLQGFLKEENTRFRDHEIKFSKYAPSSKASKTVLSYPRLEKKFNNFSLEIEAGSIGDAEIIGVLGPNGIGKTTFAKLLAGIEKPDNQGKLDGTKIALKPQYLKSDFEGTGMQLMLEAGVDKGAFNELKHKLELSDLMDKPVKIMSGGELQRLSIALNLSKDCDLRVLDEPSAFLDVEQRLNAGEAIKTITQKTSTPCLVIDHDILFIDEVSNRLMLFDGIPGKEGKAKPAIDKKTGMHSFLKQMNITFRRDAETSRPRVNKLNSQKDTEQKQNNNYYYE